MTHPARRPAIALLVSLHALLALCGPGHHAISGTDCPAAVAAEDDGAPALTTAADGREGHCPACDYFAQGQIPVAAERPSFRGEAGEPAPRERHLAPRSTSHRLGPPRAPPAPPATV